MRVKFAREANSDDRDVSLYVRERDEKMSNKEGARDVDSHEKLYIVSWVKCGRARAFEYG